MVKASIVDTLAIRTASTHTICFLSIMLYLLRGIKQTGGFRKYNSNERETKGNQCEYDRIEKGRARSIRGRRRLCFACWLSINRPHRHNFPAINLSSYPPSQTDPSNLQAPNAMNTPHLFVVSWLVLFCGFGFCYRLEFFLLMRFRRSSEDCLSTCNCNSHLLATARSFADAPRTRRLIRLDSMNTVPNSTEHTGACASWSWAERSIPCQPSIKATNSSRGRKGAETKASSRPEISFVSLFSSSAARSPAERK